MGDRRLLEFERFGRRTPRWPIGTRNSNHPEAHFVAAAKQAHWAPTTRVGARRATGPRREGGWRGGG